MRGKITRKASAAGWLLLALLPAGVCGCGRAAAVSGKVSYQGRPVTYGSVIMVGADKKARSGVIQSDGSYSVEGVAAGPVSIAVLSRDPAKGRAARRESKEAQPASQGAAPPVTAGNGWFPLPRKFENPETSGLGCTVAAGHFDHDVELK
ncbi:MAG: hypothetical protein ABSG68_07575 [Thermoguttaceae bacterium]|jgi:hypothetical protein